ncbi:MAG TPA: hypothetical protein DEP84_12460 [Chloroflexi bacterium]|nr:hypothetical protein [Chloroflexota bacterium]
MEFVAFSADQAIALNVSASDDDFTSLISKQQPGRGEVEEVVQEHVQQWGINGTRLAALLSSAALHTTEAAMIATATASSHRPQLSSFRQFLLVFF